MTVYNLQNQPIVTPPLTETAVEGQETPIGTTITFPNSGSYQLVFSGQSKENEFELFELRVPVTVRSQANQSQNQPLNPY